MKKNVWHSFKLGMSVNADLLMVDVYKLGMSVNANLLMVDV
jgi:hypothetical protein